MSQWRRNDEAEPSPEVIAAIVAAVRTVAAADDERQDQSRWLRRVRRHVIAWGDWPENWLDRVRLESVRRDR